MSEWQEVSPGVLQRPLRGAELALNHAEHENGNFELTMEAQFSSTVSEDEMEARFAAAWFRVRQQEPVVGVDLEDEQGNLQNATFRLLKTVQEAEEWIKNTARVIRDGRSVLDMVAGTVSRHMPSKGRKAMAYLVLNPRLGNPGIVYNTSHVLSGHHAIKVCESIVSNLMQDQTSRGLHANFRPENKDVLLPRLPRSCVKGYEEKYNPTPEDIEEGMEVQGRAMERFSRSSIGVPVHKDWRNRRSHAHSIKCGLSFADTAVARKAMKELDINMTTAFFACITSAMAQLYGTGEEEGAHLLFSAHAQRFFDCVGSDGKPPITMAIVPGGAFVDASSVNLKANDKDSLAELAKAIAWEMMQDLDCPHVIGAIDEMVKMAHGPDADPQENPEPTIARPTLTSQGPLVSGADFEGAGKSLSRLWATDGGYGGRNADPSICFATLSFRYDFRWHVLFDEQYFDYNEVMRLTQKVGALFRLLYQDKLPAPGDLGGCDPFTVIPYHPPYHNPYPKL